MFVLQMRKIDEFNSRQNEGYKMGLLEYADEDPEQLFKSLGGFSSNTDGNSNIDTRIGKGNLVKSERKIVNEATKPSKKVKESKSSALIKTTLPPWTTKSTNLFSTSNGISSSTTNVRTQSSSNSWRFIWTTSSLPQSTSSESFKQSSREFLTSIEKPTTVDLKSSSKFFVWTSTAKDVLSSSKFLTTLTTNLFKTTTFRPLIFSSTSKESFMGKSSSLTTSQDKSSFSTSSTSNLPVRVNYMNGFPPVKNQLGCGCCYGKKPFENSV